MIFALLEASWGTSASATAMDDHITCGLVYGALFQASKNADSEEMIAYSRPRLQVVMPHLQNYKDNPAAKLRLQEISAELEQEVKVTLVRTLTNGIKEGNAEKVQRSMHRVFVCDKVFGIKSLPLPLQSKGTQSTRWDGFQQGFYGGCLQKQRRSPSPFSDMQIQKYCRCLTNQLASKGINERSSDQESGRAIYESHPGCVASIQ